MARHHNAQPASRDASWRIVAMPSVLLLVVLRPFACSWLPPPTA